LRGKIGAIAKTANTSRELYAGLRALGLANVRTFSDLNTAEKRSLCPPNEEDRSRGWQREGTYLDYANPKNLWQFQPEVGGDGFSARGRRGRPRLWGEDYFSADCLDQDESSGRIPRWSVRRYDVVLEWSHTRQELLSQIAAVRIMAADARRPEARAQSGSPRTGLRPGGGEPEAGELAA
jgi:hypothetical protein